ncbi:MAG: polysaccharide deacetylase family protein, partial [Ruminiclostridium sp.]|nr:polysaccharide deacetylase family protein [Ruminiclostridium sp.]
MTTKMKKILSALLAAIMIGSLSGCFSDPDDNNGTTTTPKTSTTPNTTSSDTMPAPAGTGDSENTDNTGNTNPADTTPADSSGENGEYTADDNGSVGENTDDTKKTDEAAFASSYMNFASNGLSITKIGWGLGKDTDGENRPLDAVNAEERYKDFSARFLPEGKKICLTFDEGYENGYTADILDVLRERNVKAVFFVTYDYCRTEPELVQRMIDEGHVVGNHSYTHPSMPDCSENEMIEEVSVLHDYVAAQFGYEMTLFRFPKGEFSENALNVVKKLGYTSVFWSFAYNDWDTAAQP